MTTPEIPSIESSPSRAARAKLRLAHFVRRRPSLEVSPGQRESLQTTIAILRAQQEATLEGTLVVDRDGRVLSYNHRFLEIWGIPPEAATGADDNDLLGFAADCVADWEQFIELVDYLYEHPEEIRVNDVVALKDGRTLSRSSLPIVVDGEVRGRSWYFRDITERAKAERLQSTMFRISQLSREETSLDQFYATVHALIGELMDVRNFYVAEYDPVTDLLTFPYFVDQFDGPPPLSNPGRGLTAWVLRSGEPLLVTPAVFADLAARGEVELVGTPSIDWMGAPLRTGGRTWGVIGTQSYTQSTRFTPRDLEVLVFVAEHIAAAVDQKRREEALRESELRYRQMFENNRAIKLLIHPQSGAIVDANMAACDYYGWSREQLRRMHIGEINVNPPDRVREDLSRASSGDRSYFQFRHRRANGEICDVEVHSGPIEVGRSTLLFSIVHDVTERRRAESTLRQQSAAMTASMDGIGILDAQLQITYVNQSLARLFGWVSPAELLGRSLCDLYEPHEQVRLITSIVPVVQERGRWRGEATGLRRDGSQFPQEMSLTAIAGEGMVCVVRDITERTYAEEQIKHLAYHDALTNLPNRLLFKDRVTVAISHAQRESASLAVLFLDLDRFKVINDSLGHTIGDQLLQAVAARIQTCVRESDTVARLGGDEFTVLLPQLTSADDAAPVAMKIIEAIRHPFHIEGRELFITTSIGISVYPEDGMDAESLIKNADTAMYQAKESGRDRYQLFNALVNAKALQRIAIEHGLRRALQHGELAVHFQPIFDFRSGRITGAEALLRWVHPEMGAIPPSVFIPLAESSGVMIPIGTWALREACTRAREWHLAGFPALTLAVNLSVTQLQQPDLVEQVRTILKETGMPARLLELEITESSAMQSPETSIRTLYDLKKLGVRISLDDFGTGHSSLSYLKRFPIDTLKIDQSFVRDITSDPDTAAIVNAIIAMAHSLRLKVVAEGVEFTEQANFLRQHSCDQMQGYLVRPPAPAAEILEMLSSQ
jgi:diguanylate cyclase (GGDEF)-like protein/PAS domain S-box-containing protein